MQTTQNPLTSSGKSMTQSSLVIKLERNERDVGQLRSKLNSYVCEPCTYHLFERIQALKSGLDSLSQTNREIIASIKGHRKTVDDYVEKVKRQFAEFNTLRQDVDDYVSVARNYR